VDLVQFARALRELTADDIRVIAGDLRAQIGSPADEVAGTRAVLNIEQSLHRSHRSQQAGLASFAVAQAVLGAAERSGMTLPDDDVTRVARSAATLSRGLIAGWRVEDSVQFLLGGWRHIVGVRIAA
jgi:hypothetical protein